MDISKFRLMFSVNWFLTKSELEKVEAYIEKMSEHIKEAVQFDEKLSDDSSFSSEPYDEIVCSAHNIHKTEYPLIFISSTFVVLISLLERDVKKTLSLICEFQGLVSNYGLRNL